jgi:hypothetical protein
VEIHPTYPTNITRVNCPLLTIRMIHQVDRFKKDSIESP